MLAAAFGILLSLSLHAQGQSETGREADLRLEKIRAKMDSIERTRPSVALVLCGGGAKGAAHVGVIRYLEEKGIPVDIVLGTSMGGLVGGIYALGYNAAQLDTIIRSIDWSMALSDKVPSEYVSYKSRKYREKYQISVPFLYEPKEYLLYKEEVSGAPDKAGDLHLGAGEGNLRSLVKENLKESFPSGIVYGQNVNNIFSSLTVGYQDETDFYDLPIPFVCVATDMVSGKEKIWTRGKLNIALRSTMAIPGLFTPVKVDGMVLVDGGMRNNYPTDLAKECGADIIIGVNLTKDFKGYSEINNLLDIINTGIDMLGRDSFEANVDIPDVSIKPDLHEYSTLSFGDENINVIIERGYEAAEAVSAQLDSVKALVGPASKHLASRPATYLGSEKVLLSGIEITGVNDAESGYLTGRLDISSGAMVGKEEIEAAVATVYGTNGFDYVNYELLGDDNPYLLRFNCKKGPINQIGASIRADSEEVVAILLNLGLGTHRLQGPSLDFTVKIGNNPYGRLLYSYVTPCGLSVNASTGFRYTNRNTISIGENNFKIEMLDWRSEIFLSNIRWSKSMFKAGVRNDYYKVNSLMAEQSVGDYNTEDLKNDYLSLFADARNDTFDDGVIPAKGHSVGLSYSWVFKGFSNSVNPFHVFSVDGAWVIGGDDVALIPSFRLRYLSGHNVSLPYTNMMGGSIAGRYMDQQMPFIGVNNVAAMMPFLGIVRGDLRFKVVKNNYITAIVNSLVTADEIKYLFDSTDLVSNYIGIGLLYTYISLLGPVSANVLWSSYSKSVGVYVSVGIDF